MVTSPLFPAPGEGAWILFMILTPRSSLPHNHGLTQAEVFDTLVQKQDRLAATVFASRERRRLTSVSWVSTWFTKLPMLFTQASDSELLGVGG